MNPKYSVASIPPAGNDIYLSEGLANVIRTGNPKEWKSFLNSIRLNLQGRILSCEKDDLVKLQGKVEFVGEIENLLEKIISQK